MRAAAIDRFGGAERITLQTLPVPKAGPDEIVIRVETAGVAVWDTLERGGGFAKMFGLKPVFPYVLGTDGAGTVVAVGEQVARFHEGDRVCASALVNPKGGFYAEYGVANSDNAMHVPDKLTTEQAGVMLSDALTGLQGLDVLALKRDETIMIFGAGGGIGHLAVQLAKRMGARVFAVRVRWSRRRASHRRRRGGEPRIGIRACWRPGCFSKRCDTRAKDPVRRAARHFQRDSQSRSNREAPASD
jgi:NADPH:quinone reductase